MPDGKVSSSLLDDKEIKLSGQREKHRTSIFKPPYLATLLLKKMSFNEGGKWTWKEGGRLKNEWLDNTSVLMINIFHYKMDFGMVGG